MLAMFAILDQFYGPWFSADFFGQNRAFVTSSPRQAVLPSSDLAPGLFQRGDIGLRRSGDNGRLDLADLAIGILRHRLHVAWASIC